MVASFDLQQRRWNKTAKKKIRRGWKPAFNKNGVPQGYHEALKEQMLERDVRTLHDLEDLMLKAVAASERRSGDDSASKMCDTLRTDHELQSLLLRRRAVHCRSERALLSKLTKKMLRKHVRQKQNLKTEMIWKEFQDLGRLDELHRDPVRSRSQARDTDPSPESFAKFLEDIFHSNAGFGTEYLQSLLNSVKHKCRFDIPKFTMLELQRVMRQLKNRKCADADGLVAEMFKHGNSDLMNCLLELYNNMLDTGRCEPTCQHTIFTMLPKNGDRSLPNNWRPIAILKISYKIFARLLYMRLRHCLDHEQSQDQMGFRPNTGVDDALAVFESICGRSVEWNLGFGLASLDLKLLTKSSMTLYSEPYLNKAFMTHIWSCWPPYITTRQDVFTAVRTLH